MSSVLSAGEVIEGVISSVVDDGPLPPTARRLASRLHVAPATLYSAFPAMADAYAGARSSLVQELQKPLLDALGRSDSSTLVDWMSDSPSRALFVTDPAWRLDLNPMLAHALVRVGFDQQRLCDVLAGIGSLFTIDVSDVSRLNTDRIDQVIRVFGEQVDGVAPPANVVDVSAADIADVLARVDSHVADEVDVACVAAARTGSARLIVEVDRPEWSFRELGRITDIPVTRLHRYGSRLQHLERAGAPLLRAANEWAGENAATPAERHARLIAFLVKSGAAESFVELYRSCRLRQAGAGVPDFDAVFTDDLPPQVAAVLASRVSQPGRLRGTDADEVVDLASRIMTGLAA